MDMKLEFSVGVTGKRSVAFSNREKILKRVGDVLFESLDVALNNKSPDGKVTEVYLADIMHILRGLSDLCNVMCADNEYSFLDTNEEGEE